MMPSSSPAWDTFRQVETGPDVCLNSGEFIEEADVFFERLLALKERDHARARAQLRRYRTHRSMAVDGPSQRQRAFDGAARLLCGGPELRDHDARLSLVAAKLSVRETAVAGTPGCPAVRLLCDTRGQPCLTFLPVHRVASAAVRASMTTTLDEALQADQDLSLGMDRFVLHEKPGLGVGLLTQARGAGSAAELQTLALSRLFTNDWQAHWQLAPGQTGGKAWYLGGCAPFPEAAERVGALKDMQEFRGIAPLFDIPQEAGPAWDAPLDQTLAEKVLGLDIVGLQWTMELQRQVHCQDPVATPPSAEALLGAIASIRLVRTLIEEDPTLTLRQLLERFPHRLDGDDIGSSASQTENPAPSLKFSPVLEPSPVLKFSAATALAPNLIDDTELSALLRAASPFNPFRRRDRELAPLLRDAIALRRMKPDLKKERTASKLLNASYQALQRVRAFEDSIATDDWKRRDASNARATTLVRLIADTEHRIKLLTSDCESYKVRPRKPGWSWLPWRRRTQAQP